LGQKTHPIGFRLGYNKEWKSIWFDEKQFSTKLAQDIQIRKYISKRLPNAGISSLDIHRTSKKITVIVNTSRPGIIIGKKGSQVDMLKMELQKLTNTDVQVNVSEIKRPELDATLVGESIAEQVAKKVSHRRAIKKAIQGTMRMGADGIRVQIKPGWITSRQIEASRVVMSREIRKHGKMWIRIFPDKPITQKPAETRMGKGKGSPEYWVAVVKPGRILFEIESSEIDIKKLYKKVSHKLPIKTKLVIRKEH